MIFSDINEHGGGKKGVRIKRNNNNSQTSKKTIVIMVIESSPNVEIKSNKMESNQK